jgi:hypothetical protein
MLCCSTDVKPFGQRQSNVSGETSGWLSTAEISEEYMVPLDKQLCKKCPQGHNLEHFCFPQNFNCDLCGKRISSNVVFGCNVCRFGMCYECHTKSPEGWNADQVENWCEQTNGMNGYGNLLKKNSIDGRQLITLDDKEKVKKQFGLENEEKIDLILKLVENVKRILKNESFDGKSDEERNQMKPHGFEEKMSTWKTAQKCTSNRNPFTGELMGETNAMFYGMPGSLAKYF